jgi:hypothetical protein
MMDTTHIGHIGYIVSKTKLALPFLAIAASLALPLV